jgi:hypothetical protein
MIDIQIIRSTSAEPKKHFSIKEWNSVYEYFKVIYIKIVTTGFNKIIYELHEYPSIFSFQIAEEK